eukprot:276443-Pleurochrysis_carterae.AAC.5
MPGGDAVSRWRLQTFALREMWALAVGSGGRRRAGGCSSHGRGCHEVTLLVVASAEAHADQDCRGRAKGAPGPSAKPRAHGIERRAKRRRPRDRSRCTSSKRA